MRLAPDESLTAFRQELEAWLDENQPAPEVTVADAKPASALTRYTARNLTRPSTRSSEGPTTISAHMLNAMWASPMPSPGGSCRKALVSRRYQSPTATPTNSCKFGSTAPPIISP